jgi:integrase
MPEKPSKARTRNHSIHQASYRRRLEPRPKDPYKAVLGKGRWIGYLKGEAGSESWCACWIDDQGIERQRVVGGVHELEYEAARALVDKEIDIGLKGGGSDRHYTVHQACEDYVTHKETIGGKRSANSARNTLKPFVQEHPIGSKRLRDLRHRDIETWQKSLTSFRTQAQTEDVRKDKPISRKPNTVNRTLRIFKAALNYAKARKIVGSNDAWVDIKALKAKEGQRDVYLNLDQRRLLLNACDDDTRKFLLAMLHTAARPNEVRDLTVHDFNRDTGTLRIVKYKGTGVPDERVTYLSPDGVAFFKEQAKDKTPKAPLLTQHGEKWRRHKWAREIQRAVKRANDKLKADDPKIKDEDKLPTDIVAYTMRHTAISEWLGQGIDIGRVAKAVGTSVKMIEMHYQQFIKPDFVEKLALFNVV